MVTREPRQCGLLHCCHVKGCQLLFNRPESAYEASWAGKQEVLLLGCCDAAYTEMPLMCAGEHMGKVLIQIADMEGPLARSGPLTELEASEEPEQAPEVDLDPPVKAVFTARPDCSYVITGGMGGFGLALAGWLAAKGAGHLVLTSKRYGHTWQRSRLPARARRSITAAVQSHLVLGRFGLELAPA